jgi:hypothetical protein
MSTGVRQRSLMGAAVLIALGTAAEASATSDEPAGPVHHGESAELLVGGGIRNGFAFGLGARIGVTLLMNLYLGGTFVYHTGTSPSGTTEFSQKVYTYYGGGEVGYALAAGPIEIRPYAGVGVAEWVHSAIGPWADSSSVHRVAVWPGATFIYPIETHGFIGGDARLVIVSGTNGDGIAPCIFGTVGATF